MRILPGAAGLKTGKKKAGRFTSEQPSFTNYNPMNISLIYLDFSVDCISLLKRTEGCRLATLYSSEL